MCVHDSGVLTEPGGGEEPWVREGMGGARACGKRGGGRSVRTEFRWRRVRDWGSGSRGGVLSFEDRVCDATSVGDGEVTPDQGLTSSAFAFVRGGVGDGTVNEV